MSNISPKGSEFVRVGVVEAGSGSIRLVTLDVAADNSFRIVDSKGTGIDLEGGLSETMEVEVIAKKASDYAKRCAGEYCDRVVVFSTELGRRWSESARKYFKHVIPSFTVLTAKQEAGFALFGSLLRLQTTLSEDPFSTIDMGRGSTELSLGRAHGKFVELLNWQSWPAGGHVARNILRKCNYDIGKTCRQLSKLIPSVRFEVPPSRRVIALGNCATTLGRVTRFPEMEKLDMSVIHGLELTIQDVCQFIDLYQQRPERFRVAVEGRNGFSDVDATLGGLLVLQLVCARASIVKFTVSTYGVRFGVAVWCAQQVMRRDGASDL